MALFFARVAAAFVPRLSGGDSPPTLPSPRVEAFAFASVSVGAAVTVVVLDFLEDAMGLIKSSGQGFCCGVEERRCDAEWARY